MLIDFRFERLEIKFGSLSKRYYFILRRLLGASYKVILDAWVHGNHGALQNTAATLETQVKGLRSFRDT